jgi:23S rRNA pseudouridine2605 synthase
VSVDMIEPQRSGRMRLQKFLSDAGVASRRHAEELILDGRVLVNDEIVDTLPAFVDPQRDRVIVNGALIRPQPLEYFLVHKPKGVVCTNRDPAGRVRASDLLPPLKQRLFPVGRLDEESSGLLLMTNDGELAERITHPRNGVPKVYHAEVRGRVPDDLPERLRRGVYLAEGLARASEVEIVRADRDRSVLLITLREGRNRQVRRMLARLGHAVRRLKRLQIGPLSLKGLPVGGARRLTPVELKTLRAALADQGRADGRAADQSRRVRTPAERGGWVPGGGRGGRTERPRGGGRGRGGKRDRLGPGRRIVS